MHVYHALHVCMLLYYDGPCYHCHPSVRVCVWQTLCPSASFYPPIYFPTMPVFWSSHPSIHPSILPSIITAVGRHMVYMSAIYPLKQPLFQPCKVSLVDLDGDAFACSVLYFYQFACIIRSLHVTVSIYTSVPVMPPNSKSHACYHPCFCRTHP